MAASNVPKGCVESDLFYSKLEELKESKKAKSSKTTLFIEDSFFDETKTWLQTNPEERKSLNPGKANQADNYKEQLHFVKWRKDCHLR